LQPQTEVINGIIFTFNSKSRDRYILERVVVDNIYGVADSLKDKIVIDIGAHIGAFTTLAASKGAKVFAIEPKLSNYQLLLGNILQNNLVDKITAYNCAISFTEGWQRLYISDWCSGCNSLSVKANTSLAEDKYEMVWCDTIEAIINRNSINSCTLLKIDCEGAEEIILPVVLKNYVDIVDSIAIEFHSKSFFNSIINDIRKNYSLAIEVSPLEWRFSKYLENV